MPAAERMPIPRWRKALYSLVTLGVLLVPAGLGLRWWAAETTTHLPPPLPTDQSVRAYLDRVRGDVTRPRCDHQDGQLPGALDPRVLVRVPPGTPGAVVYDELEGHVVLRRPARLLPPGAAPAVLILGGSAAYGQKEIYPNTLGPRLAAALRRKPGLERTAVLTLGRPGWELASVALLCRRLLRELPRRPDALVLITGNNEFLYQRLEGLGHRPWEAWPVYRALHETAARWGWLRRRPGIDPSYHTSPDWHVIPPAVMRIRLWWPARGIDDAGHLPLVRRVVLDHFRDALGALVAEVRRAGVPLVLVTPPINLFFFPAGVFPQPATTRAVGRRGYEAVAERLDALLRAPTLPALRALVRDEPSGPIQRFLLAQTLDERGEHREAMAHYRAARDAQTGLLGALPTIHGIIRAQARPADPGLAVVATDDWYDPSRSIRKQSHKLFFDSCHPTAEGVTRLTRQVAPALLRLLRARYPAPGAHATVSCRHVERGRRSGRARSPWPKPILTDPS